MKRTTKADDVKARANMVRLVQTQIRKRWGIRRDPKKLERWIEHLQFAYGNSGFITDEDEYKYYLVKRHDFVMNYGLSETELLYIWKNYGGNYLIADTEYVDFRSVLACLRLMPDHICEHFKKKR